MTNFSDSSQLVHVLTTGQVHDWAWQRVSFGVDENYLPTKPYLLVGVLVDHVLSDGSTQKVFQLNLTFDAGEVSGLRGKQFVIAGVTRTQFVRSASDSARVSVSLNLLTDDPASETWWVGELAVATIPTLSSSSP